MTSFDDVQRVSSRTARWIYTSALALASACGLALLVLPSGSSDPHGVGLVRMALAVIALVAVPVAFSAFAARYSGSTRWLALVVSGAWIVWLFVGGERTEPLLRWIVH